MQHLHVDDERMLNFFQNRDFIAQVLDLLQSNHVDHGENFQSERRFMMPAENHSAERACAWKFYWHF